MSAMQKIILDKCPQCRYYTGMNASTRIGAIIKRTAGRKPAFRKLPMPRNLRWRCDVCCESPAATGCADNEHLQCVTQWGFRPSKRSVGRRVEKPMSFCYICEECKKSYLKDWREGRTA
jgi:hypothetical protein